MTRKPVLLGTAAVVGLWSTWIAMQPRTATEGAVVAAAVLRAPAPRPAPASGVVVGRSVAPAAVAASSQARLAAQSQADAFAARNWVPPPPPPPPVPPAPPPPPPPAPAPPPAPVLPYRFIGLLDEGRGKPMRVFLSLGDKLLVAGVGDQLDGGFTLVNISGQELVFNHPRTNTALRLALPQERS